MFRSGGEAFVKRVETWFDSIYSKYYKEMIGIAFHLLGDRELAKDITQSAFLALLTKYDQLRNHPNIEGWLRVTVRNLVWNEQKKAHYSVEVPLSPEYEPAVSSDASSFLALLPPELKEEEQQVLYFFYEVGLTHEEIAARLGCTPEACRMRLYRAKKHYHDLLGKKS